jgi:hypothetical protein
VAICFSTCDCGNDTRSFVAEYERCLKLKITVPAMSIIVNVRTAKTSGSNGDLNFVDV